MPIKKIVKKITPSFLLSFYHYLLALTGAFWHRFPGRKITVIGVTGTKGKSTTVILAGKILEEAGYKVAWFTSATIKIGEKEWLNSFHMTMPGRFIIQRFLRRAVKAGCKFAILEVTSEGIKQCRHKFISFNTAVFTNLKPEHIEAHGSFENYRNAKLQLFKATKELHIINLDDENSKYFSDLPTKEKWFFAIKNIKVDLCGNCKLLTPYDIKELQNGTTFKMRDIIFNLNLLGNFNIYNALAAISVGLSQGISLGICKSALEKVMVMPGRMEVIIEKPFKIIVDLAHTPDSYEEVFKAVKSMPYNRIISVFGSAGGGRDKWKRPVLGKIAVENSDIIILTNEDPYDENPLSILAEIESGFSQTPNSKLRIPKCEKILDRREAIKKALEIAKENDIVLILGKGTEQLMMVSGKKIPWDDRRIVKEEFDKLNRKQ